MTDFPDAEADAPAHRRATSWPVVLGFAIAGVVSVLAVILRQQVPLTSGGAVVDDYTYVRIGAFLAHGQWLGPFDQYTLLKGPGYPAFMAAMYRLGIPLKIGEQLTYLLAAAALAGCVWIVTRRTLVALGAYVVLALDPVNFAAYASRATRDGWYSSLSLLLVAAVFLTVYAALTDVGLRWVIGGAVLAGLTAGAFWLTREEPLWIVPTLLVIVAGLPLLVLARWWRARPRSRLDRDRVLRAGGHLGLALAVIAILLIAPVAGVARMNDSHYGSALTNDLVYGSFARAYADWRRVDGGRSTPEDPITRAQRAAVYAVSPAARLLKPYLDPTGPCPDVNPTPPCASPVWKGLRDAAALTGNFGSEADAQRFFAAIDAQIVAGCASGQLDCTKRLPTQMQSLEVFSAGPFASYAGHLAGMVLVSRGFFDPPTNIGGRLTDPTERPTYEQVVRGLPDGVAASNDQLDRFAAHDGIYRLLTVLYRFLLPCLFVAGVIGALTPIKRPRWPRAALSILALSLAVGVVTRLVFVALLDNTDFDTSYVEVRYMLPVHALFVAFGVIGTAGLVDAWWTSRGDRPRGAHVAGRDASR